MQQALAALSCLTDADDVDSRDIIEGYEVPGTAQLPGEMERVLPQVHITWGFVVPGLRAHTQPARLEAALDLIAHVAECSGSFITKRMQTDVLPQLKRLTAGSKSIATRGWVRSGGVIRAVEDVAPGTVSRCQVLAFNMLDRMCQHSSSRQALEGIVSELSQEAVETMCRASTGAPVREHCAAALKGLAAVDAQAVRSALEPYLNTTSSQTTHALIQSLLLAVGKVTIDSVSSHKAILDSSTDKIEAKLGDLEIDAGS